MGLFSRFTIVLVLLMGAFYSDLSEACGLFSRIRARRSSSVQQFVPVEQVQTTVTTVEQVPVPVQTVVVTAPKPVRMLEPFSATPRLFLHTQTETCEDGSCTVNRSFGRARLFWR